MNDDPKSKQIEETKHLMSALMRMKLKPHEEMKIGKKTKQLKKSRRKPPKKTDEEVVNLLAGNCRKCGAGDNLV